MGRKNVKVLLWFLIATWAVTSDKVIVQLNLHGLKINDKAMKTIKAGKGKATDCRKKIITQYQTPLNGRATVRNDKCAQQLWPP